jgi:tetratricopeptide (TPR) repeat protein
VDDEQSQSTGKNEVLNQLGRLTMRLESKSEASFVALQKNAVPLEAATTSSLEALKSFSVARHRVNATAEDSFLLFQRAIELDPDFAVAYAWLGRAYADAGEQNLAMQNIRHAYRLRSIVSDRENFFITYNYDREVLRNLEIAREAWDSWIEKYPRDVLPHGFLSGLTSKGTAQYDKAHSA